MKVKTKTLNIAMMLIGDAIGLALGFGGNELAFHSGGVAECVG